MITLSPQEFIRRFLLHVLPHAFVKIRHYGLWAAGNVSTRLPAARALLPAAPPAPAPASEEPLDAQLDWQVRLLRLTGIDITRCPRCDEGTMVPHSLIAPARTAPMDSS